MLPLLLIDTRDLPPEPEPERRPSVVAGVLTWMYPWPAILVWLFIATALLDGLAGAVTGYVMLCGVLADDEGDPGGRPGIASAIARRPTS